MQTQVVGRTWPSGNLWFAKPCSRAMGIKKGESSNQELVTHWLRVRNLGFCLWTAALHHQSVRIMKRGRQVSK